MSTGDGQGVFRNLLGNGAAGTDVGVGLYGYRSNQIGVAADKGIVADDGAMLFLAVVVDSDAATAHINTAADITVTDIRQMRQLGACADVGVFTST